MVMGPENQGNEQWHAEKEMIDRAAQQAHEVHELEEGQDRDAAEAGVAPPKRPWWRFWAK